jgi:hypothetical protein
LLARGTPLCYTAGHSQSTRQLWRQAISHSSKEAGRTWRWPTDTLYKTIRLLRFPFAYHCTGLENIPDRGPAIYVANHLDSVGPVEVVLSLPVRFHLWVIAEMTDPRRAPRYLYNDFVHPIWHLGGRFGMAVSTVLSWLTVGLIKGMGSIPVDRNRRRYMSSFRRSLALLQEGRSLLIFPEDPAGPMDPETQMRPFLCGFLLLCPMYERLAAGRLPVYPLAVYRQGRIIAAGKPLFFESHGNRSGDARAFGRRLQQEVGTLYRALKGA